MVAAFLWAEMPVTAVRTAWVHAASPRCTDCRDQGTLPSSGAQASSQIRYPASSRWISGERPGLAAPRRQERDRAGGRPVGLEGPCGYRGRVALTAKGTATRQRIIEGAATYLRSDEPGEVTLDDVRAITGTSKGQIFHYFPGGKEELLLAVARHEADRVLADQQPYLGALTTWAAWERWRDAVVARYRAQGRFCPLGSLMSQVGSTPGAAEVITALMSQWQAQIRHGIEQMQPAGQVRPAWTPTGSPPPSSPASRAACRCCARPGAPGTWRQPWTC